MDFFRKGSDPPPPYFRKLWNPWGTFDFWSPKRGKTKLPKNTQNGHILNKLLGKVPKSVHNPLFNTQNSLTLEAQKCAPKLWIGSRPPPPYGRNP